MYMQANTYFRIAGIIVISLLIGLGRNLLFPGSLSFSNNSKPTAAQPDTLTLEISVSTAFQLYQDSVRFIDARTPKEFKKSHIPGALNIPAGASFEEKSKLTSQLNQETMYVVYCNDTECPLSHQLYEFLQFANFTNTHIMYEGIDAWDKADLPIVHGEADDSE